MKISLPDVPSGKENQDFLTESALWLWMIGLLGLADFGASIPFVFGSKNHFHFEAKHRFAHDLRRRKQKN